MVIGQHLSEEQLRDRLRFTVKQSPWLMAALSACRELGLASWCIGAGAVRNLVWDDIHGFSTPSQLPDVDLVYYEASDLSHEHDHALLMALRRALPGVPWEVTNQAGVHLWYEQAFGQKVAPLKSLEDGIATWPEYATAVGVFLLEDDQIEIVAPHGLQDLFTLAVRHNPIRASKESFLKRVAEKRFSERWPMVLIIPV